MKNMNSFGSDNTVFIDCFIVLVFYMCILLSLSLLLIGEKDSEKAPKPNNEFMITVTWPTGDNSDIDLWARRDLDQAKRCYFQRREVDVFTLNNDNTGSKYDARFGENLSVARETMTIATLEPGFYEFSLHGYRVPTSRIPHSTAVFTVERLNPYEMVFTGSVDVAHGQEVPVVSFDVSKEKGAHNVEKELLNNIMD